VSDTHWLNLFKEDGFLLTKNHITIRPGGKVVSQGRQCDKNRAFQIWHVVLLAGVRDPSGPKPYPGKHDR